MINLRDIGIGTCIFAVVPVIRADLPEQLTIVCCYVLVLVAAIIGRHEGVEIGRRKR